MEKINCPTCESDDFIFLFKAKDNLHGIKGEFDIVMCRECRLIITNPRPDKKEIAKFYPDSYQPYLADLKKINLIIFLRKVFGNIINLFYEDTIIVNSEEKKLNILEIGCGGGNFLREYKKMYPTHDLLGLDFNEKVVERLRKEGLNIACSDLTSINLLSASIDCVYGWMILEHVHDINKVLEEIHRILKKSGKLIVSVPNIRNFQFHIFKEKSYIIQAPAHLYHFSPDTIKNILSKHKFKIDKIIYQKTFRDTIESLRILFICKNWKKAGKMIPKWNLALFLLTYPLGLLLSILRQSPRMSIIATKYE